MSKFYEVEQIVAKSKEMSDLRNQLQENMIRHRLNVAKVLTKEQRAQFSRVGHQVNVLCADYPDSTMVVNANKAVVVILIWAKNIISNWYH